MFESRRPDQYLASEYFEADGAGDVARSSFLFACAEQTYGEIDRIAGKAKRSPPAAANACRNPDCGAISMRPIVVRVSWGLPLIANTLNRLGRAARRYIVTGRFGAAPGPIIERFFGGRDCFFVQVGSNDGVRGDPLHAAIKANPKWRGIFVEPLNEAFERLVTNYPSDGRFAFERLAIANSNGEQWLYYVSRETIRETGLPSSAQGIGSLNRDHPLRHLIGAKSFASVRFTKEPEAYLSKKLVRCETLATVLDRHRVSHIDVFHVDAETYDYKIIRQIDFERFCPKVILYEHAMLGDEMNAARSFLSEKGYRLIHCGMMDTMAVRRGAPLRKR